jgi:hypothetical protein
MNKHSVQRPRRFQISRRGELAYQDHRFACLLQDISAKGMFIICNYDLEIGLELEVSFELEPGSNFRAKIKVRHFKDGCFGAEIVETDPRSEKNWNEFMETHFAGQLRLSERRVRV